MLVPFAAFGESFPYQRADRGALAGRAVRRSRRRSRRGLLASIAAGLAAALVGTAPFAVESGSLLMSDALVAALTVMVAGLLQRGWFRAAALVSGGLVLMRLSAIVAVPSVILAVPASMRWRVAAYTLPGVLLLGCFSGGHLWQSDQDGLRLRAAGPANLRRRLRLAAAYGRPTNAGRRHVRWTPARGAVSMSGNHAGPLARLPNVL